MVEIDTPALFDSSRWSRGLRLLVFGVALTLAVWAGATLTVEDSLLVFWPAAGIYVAVLLLHPRREWPFYVLAAMPSSAVFAIVRDAPLAVAFVFYLCGTIQALVGAELVRRFVAKRPSLGNPREIIGFLLLAGVVGTAAGSAVAGWVATQVRPGVSVMQAFAEPWVATALGVVILAPLPLRAVRGDLRPPRSWARALEAGALGGLAVAASWITFTAQGPFSLTRAYLLIPLLVWAAVRFGMPGTALTHFVVVSTAMFGLDALGPSLAARGALASGYTFNLQAFLGVGAAAFLVLAAALEERESINRALSEVNQWMEHLVTSSPIPVVAADRAGRVLVWNDAAEGMFGWTADEVLGERFDYIPGHYLQQYQAARDRVFAGERLTRFPGEMLTKDGEVLTVLVSAAPVYRTDRSVWGLIAVFEEYDPGDEG